MRPQRILIQPLFRWPSLASTIAAIVEQEHGQSEAVEFAQILQPIDNIPRVSMTPKDHGVRRRGFDVPPKEARPIGSLKPNLFQRQPTEPSPVSILPRLGMIDEELIKNTDSGLFLESQ